MTYWILIVVAGCVTWTVTKEEIFRPFRDWLGWVRERAEICGRGPWGEWQTAREAWWRRWRWSWLDRLAYMPTCDYCFAHWVMLALVLVVRPAPLVGAGVVGWGLTYFTLVAGTAALTTLFGIARQVQKLVCVRAGGKP